MRQSAWIIRRRRRYFSNRKLHRFGRVLRQGIEGMLARVQDRQYVHFGAQFDEHSGFRVAGYKLHVAAGINNDLAEQINWGGQISCREPVLRELDDKTV